jgi:hypothetical protein
VRVSLDFSSPNKDLLDAEAPNFCLIGLFFLLWCAFCFKLSFACLSLCLSFVAAVIFVFCSPLFVPFLLMLFYMSSPLKSHVTKRRMVEKVLWQVVLMVGCHLIHQCQPSLVWAVDVDVDLVSLSMFALLVDCYGWGLHQVLSSGRDRVCTLRLSATKI